MKKIIGHIKKWAYYDRPRSATSDGWVDWEREFQQNAPIRYMIFEKFPDEVITPVKVRIRHAIDEVGYRIRRHHILDTGLEPGYYDKDSLMLHVNFNLLKDFVEVEKASMSRFCHEDKKTWKDKIPFRRYFVKPRSSRELGWEYLVWESNLDDPSSPHYSPPPIKSASHTLTQAEAAREVMELYTWWVDVRPTREEPEYETPTVEDRSIMYLCSQRFKEEYPDEAERFEYYAKETRRLEELWRKEDDEYLIRLIKLRHNLWT